MEQMRWLWLLSSIGTLNNGSLVLGARRYQEHQELSSEGTHVVISRQGVTLFDQIANTYRFGADQVHKEFLISFPEHHDHNMSLYVAHGDATSEGQPDWYCGMGKMTQQESKCEQFSAEVLQKLADEASSIAHLAPRTTRGFGVELEYLVHQTTIGNDSSSGGKDCFNAVTASMSPVSLKYLSKWGFGLDSTVFDLPGEKGGKGLELTSPGPSAGVLSGQAGLQSAAHMVAIYKRIGIAAVPTAGLHVHVNVLNKNAPGERLSLLGIATVWAAYAKYQLVIDELLSPSRVGNKFAEQALFLRGWNNIFVQLHEALGKMTQQQISSLDVDQSNVSYFCGASVFGVKTGRFGGAPKPIGRCETMQHTSSKYHQLNLIPLVNLGTLEFRAHSATYSQERMGRWVQFVVAFVEHYGKGAGHTEMASYFEKPLEIAEDELKRAQAEATSKDLFSELAELLDSGSESFYGTRAWEVGDPTCPTDGDDLPGQRNRPLEFPNLAQDRPQDGPGSSTDATSISFAVSTTLTTTSTTTTSTATSSVVSASSTSTTSSSLDEWRRRPTALPTSTTATSRAANEATRAPAAITKSGTRASTTPQSYGNMLISLCLLFFAM